MIVIDNMTNICAPNYIQINEWLHMLRPVQNGWHFGDITFIYFFFKYIFDMISVQFTDLFFSKGPTENKSALFQVLCDAKLLSEPNLHQFLDSYMRR